MEAHLRDLNDKQREAVLATEGPLLVIAGAGAGKTRVIAHRILHLMHRGVAPDAILAITFTNKAAREMRERVEELVRSDVSLHRPATLSERPLIRTFHGLGAELLREWGEEVGVPARFLIYDRNDSLRAVKEAVRHVGFDPKVVEPGKLLGVISRRKGDGIGISEFGSESTADPFARILVPVWRRYETALRDERALDFDDLLLKTAELLRRPPVRARCAARWRYLHVDEYQDTNRVQYEIARALSAEHRNICVVGDVDQNIYSWRGSDIRILLDFEKDYPDAKVVLLERNYRSTKRILAVANRIIEKNKLRKEKRLFTENPEGERVGLYEASDGTDEAAFVADRTKLLIGSGVPPREIAVLYRANFQSRELEEAFLNGDIPYQVLGTRFFARKEVKDVLSYLRAAREEGTTGDLKRILNVPPRGIGKVSLLRILAGKEDELPPAARRKLAEFRALLVRIKKASETGPIGRALRLIIAESGIEEELMSEKGEGEERLENVRELVTFASRYDAEGPAGVDRFLTDAALAGDQDELAEHRDAVRLMTVHAAKGLEFDHVFVTGLEDALFPHRRLDGNESPAEEEEERRLFYVALTRARKKVILAYASARTIFGERRMNIPSEFIFDIDKELLEQEIALHERTFSGKTIRFE